MPTQARALSDKARALANELEQLTLENSRLKRRYEALRRTCQITQALLSDYAASQQPASDLAAVVRPPTRQEEALLALDQQIQLLSQGSVQFSQLDSQPFAWRRDPLEWFQGALQQVDWSAAPVVCPKAGVENTAALVRPFAAYMAQYKAAETPEEAAAAEKLAEVQCQSVNMPPGINYWFQYPYLLYRAHVHASADGRPQVPEEVWGPLLAAMDLTPEQQEQVTDLFLVFEDLQAPYVQRRKQLLQLLSQSEAWLQSQLASGSPAAATTPQADLAASAAQGQPQQQVVDPLLAPVSAAAPTMAAAAAQAPAALTPTAAQKVVELLSLQFHQLAWLEFCFHYLSLCLLDWRQYMELVLGYDGQLQITTWEARVAALVQQQRTGAGSGRQHRHSRQSRAAAGSGRPTPDTALGAAATASTGGHRLSSSSAQFSQQTGAGQSTNADACAAALEGRGRLQYQDVQGSSLQQVSSGQGLEPGPGLLLEQPHLQLAPGTQSIFQVASAGSQQQLGSTSGMKALLGGMDLEEGDWLLGLMQQEGQ